MSTIDPNEGISGSDKTTGEVIGSSEDNLQFENQVLDFNQFLFFQNDQGFDGSTMEATDTPGEYLLTTEDGQQFKVINTDEVDLDPEVPLKITEDDNPNLVLGGDQDINVRGLDQDNQIMGNLGDNKIAGGKGDDLLGGGAGDDTLWGGEGDDQLLGGEGDDRLTGGAGADTFGYPRNAPPGEEEAQEGYSYGDDVIRDFGTGDDTLILGDFNGDGAFDSNDYTIENTEGGALITFIGEDGSLGSVLLKGVDASQLNINAQDVTGQITLSGNAAQTAATDQAPENPEDDDDDTFFTIV